MQKELVMRYPSSWHGEMWREGAPFGSGLIGGMVYGGIYREIIAVNHALLWMGGHNQELPDIHDCLPKIRKLLDEQNAPEADLVITNALREAGYRGDFVRPCPLCDLLIETDSHGIYSHYRREIDMEKAEIRVTWQEGEAQYCRQTFASRKDHRVYVRYTAQNGTIQADFSLTLHDPETRNPNLEIPRVEQYARKDQLYFAAENVSVYKPGDFGAVCRILTDGKMTTGEQSISVSDATEITAVLQVFVETPREEGFAAGDRELAREWDYAEELAVHQQLHGTLFHGVDFCISEGNRSNEELLLEAFEESPSNELMEKLYAYGRYLFLCSTSDQDTLPCHLTGLFNGSWQCFWAFYMYNVNFEMIYWQALSGNLPNFLRLALDYTESFLPDFRENARKIFGCRGILINSVNAPDSGLFKCLAPHIVNWTGGAAWFAQHFWDYYCYTGDEAYLREHALPFLYETALFYEDFAVENPDGYYDLYPSVSPENSPLNIKQISPKGREIETAKNAAMEFALLKELLTNLLQGCRITGMYADKTAKWKEMLGKIRPYMVNEDGAIKEWSDPFYRDHYAHRHHSHLYPVFPGNEIDSNHPLYPAFEHAEDLRLQFGIRDQSSWSMVFMAGIAARMKRNDFSLFLLETIARTCLMNNFLTVHNDWRRMGPIACADFRKAPFQIDGNIGIPAAVHEMLLQSQSERLEILPSLPSKWKKGHITGLLGRGKIGCDIFWEETSGYCVLHAEHPVQTEIRLGSGYTFGDGTIQKNVSVSGRLILPFVKNYNTNK
ncbi:MAG: glycosyl hydrolase family 95 catalytic domain-containing protein [Candidatus Merdivicinus sp.]|jgi:alpha-L-fucosidase 2